MSHPKIEIFRDRRGEYRWHLRASNGQIVCQGESHKRQRDALRAVLRVQETFASATLAEGAK